MGPVLEQLPEGSRVAVIRLRSLGDCVLTTPALAVLKAARPDLRVAVVVETRFFSVFEDNPSVDKILPPSLRALRQWRPVLTLDLHGGPRARWLALLSGAAFTATFAGRPHAVLYRIRIPTAQQILGLQRKVHTAEHLASAMFYLGAPTMEIPRACVYAEAVRRERPYAVLHPFATGAGKAWPAAHFVAVAQGLWEQRGLEPVFIGSASDDFTPFTGFHCLAGASLREVKNLLAGACLFVGNDSGPAHMAAALDVPAVVIFGVSDPEIWGPWRARAEVIVAQGPIESVTVAEVLAAAERLGVAA
ncbi:MAG: glycosyltransferase family 9 protein [Bryobacterales bacterium]|nr:glycosyltransferase family 9 protein [Bryobacteraceae bacterium]MDW8355730.1 glycosyltransferase family 9 protein [Bryobacterales bacterium]